MTCGQSGRRRGHGRGNGVPRGNGLATRDWKWFRKEGTRLRSGWFEAGEPAGAGRFVSIRAPHSLRSETMGSTFEARLAGR
jgi:hypothetical protein